MTTIEKNRLILSWIYKLTEGNILNDIPIVNGRKLPIIEIEWREFCVLLYKLREKDLVYMTDNNPERPHQPIEFYDLNVTEKGIKICENLKKMI